MLRMRTLLLALALVTSACSTSVESSAISDAVTATSSAVARATNCDANPLSLRAQGVEPFLVCTSTDPTESRIIVKFAQVDPTENTGRETLQEVCVVGADRPRLMQYAAVVHATDDEFAVDQNDLRVGSTKQFVSDEGNPFYRVVAGPMTGGYRYRTVHFVGEHEVTCAVLADGG